MSTFLFPPTKIDCYKFGHELQAADGTEFVYEYMTARGSRIPEITSVLTFGVQAYLDNLEEDWNVGFFWVDKQQCLDQWNRRKDGMLGPNDIGDEHIARLHDLGYLPIVVRAIAEGTEVPLRVPILTIENTVPGYGWLVGLLETNLQNNTWHPITSATTALRFRRLLDSYAEKTSSVPEFADWQGHDFSYRGLTSDEQAAASGAAHLLSFAGTDTVPALDWIEDHYAPTERFLGGSVAATEHSIMCSGGPEGEMALVRRLLTEVYPTGIFSNVSDSYDFWKFVTVGLVELKPEIMARDGKFVVRPDSGDPADILCGTARDLNSFQDPWKGADRTPEEKGLIECLWDIFGGTVNDKGYKELDPHIGAIYGDSITYERAADILNRLEAKGFASTNVVFGVGSFTYQHVTRDTFGFAEKETWIQVNGEGRNIFKDPKTDSGLKKSAMGRLAVFMVDGVPKLKEMATPEEEASPDNLLKEVFRDGALNHRYTWDEIVDRVGVRVLR